MVVKEGTNELSTKLVDKSIEAFILGLEIYNKPTIKYRIEGFSFFNINAWELMLKAELLNRGEEIFYRQNGRTISISDVIKKIYTDKNQPLRLNLEKIIELRNTSTHFITEDYETIYAPFFQANVFNFTEQIKRFHNIEMSKHIAQNFLTLSVDVKTLTNEEIRATYTSEIAERLITVKDDASFVMSENSSNDLYIPLRHDFYITKNPKKADLTVGIDNKSDVKIKVVKEMQDPSDRYKLTYGNIVKSVNKQLSAKSIKFNYVTAKGNCEFNTYTLELFSDFYSIKSNDKYAFKFANVYRYSQQLVDFIISEIQKDADLIEHIKNAKEKR